MPLDTTWMDAMPAVVLPGQRVPTPPPAQQSYTDVIDVGGPRHSPNIPAGEPGSELAPSAVGTGGKGGAPTDKPDTSWMDAMPAVVLPHQSPARDPNDHRITGPIANMGAGTSDALAGAIGAPVDLMTGAINLGLKGVYGAGRAVSGVVGGQKPPDETPQITNPVGGSDSIKSLFGTIGADPRNVVADGDVDRYARAAGSGAASMVIPWAGARALPALAGIPGALQQAMGSGSAAGQAATGVGAGVGGQAGEDLAPEPLKPLANMAGQIAGGAAVAVPAAVARGVGGAVRNQVSSFTAPFTKAGQERLAGQRIGGAASDLGAVHEALDNPAPLLVPGSEPTTFQATGDLGLGNLERSVAKDNPERFIERANDQNTARIGAIEHAQAEGDPEAVGRRFRSQQEDMDRANEGVLAGYQQNAQQATDTLGNAPPVGADAQDSVLQRFGTGLRGKLDALNQAWKGENSKLYAAVDPDGTLTVDMRPFREAVGKIAKERPKNLGPMPGGAGQVFGTAQMQPAVQKFSEVGALRQRIGDEMAAEMRANGSTQTYRYLTMLRSALDDTLSGTVAEKAASDAAAVRDGVMAPGDAIQSRFASQDSNAAPNAPANSGKDVGVGERSGQPGEVSGRAGEYVPAGEGHGNAGGGGAVSAEPTTEVAPPELAATWDQNALTRRRDADAAHSERMQTFGRGAPGVGSVLQQGSRPGEFRMGASQVPANLFTSGKGGAERIQAFQRAAGDDPTLMHDLQDYAAFSFRRAAEDADGTINPKKAAQWREQHAEVMGAFPDLAAKFDTATSARVAMDDAASRQVANRKIYETTAVSRLMGDADPVRTVGRILNSDNALAQMQDLARKTAGDPAARAGLRRAVVEHILDNLRGNQKAGEDRLLKNDAFQTFVRKTPAALRTIFSADEVQSIQNVAADLQQTQRSVSGTKLPGGSNTAQDLAAGEKHGSHGPSILSSVIAAQVGGEVMGHAMGHATGGVSRLVGKTMGMVVVPIANAMRSAGMDKVDELVTAAMLNPALAKTLLAKVPPSASAGSALGKIIAGQLQALASTAAVTSSQKDRK